jgi:hypothetical protein
LGLYGIVRNQQRRIAYTDREGSKTVINDIEKVIADRKADPNLFITEDVTEARITYSFIRFGSPVPSNIRSQVPDIRDSSQDNAGHIVGSQLGGSGRDLNNLFAQEKNMNQNGGLAWRRFEDSIRRNIDDPLLDVCGCGNLEALLKVELKYGDPRRGTRELLRPIRYEASVVYTNPFSGERLRLTPDVDLPNP